jgi:hypothetical protein
MARPLFAVFVLIAALAAESRPEPTLYDLVINGESFTVEANRSMKLESKKTPGVTYDVALRIAPVQRLVLNRIQLDYDRGAEVADGGGDSVRTVTLKHELGYTLVVSDVGGEMTAAARDQVRETLEKSMQRSFREAQSEDIKIAPRHERKFAHARGDGVTIQYHDAQGRARTCLIYVLAGQGFTASAIVQFADADHEDVLPLVKKTLDSVSPRGKE